MPGSPAPPPTALPIRLDDYRTEEVGMRRLLVRARQLAASEDALLIVGEPGTGKSLLARAIHGASARLRGPLGVLGPGDVGLPDLRGDLADGPDADGLLARHAGGTLLLDELQDWPAPAQHLLEGLLDRAELPQVDGAPRPDVRLIATASTADHGGARIPPGVQPGLYQRLQAGELLVPPLVARPADLPRLAADFLRRHADRRGQAPAELSQAALEHLHARRWHGNLRELDQALRAASVAVGPGGRIQPGDLPPPLEPLLAQEHLPYRLDALERWAYARALRAASGSRRQAIAMLGVAPATFYRKARRFGLLGS